MADPLSANQNPLEGLRRRWAGLDSTARLGVLAVVCLLITGGVGYSLSQRAEMQPLMTGLSAREASEVVRKLDEMKVSYQLSDGGSAILVSSKELYKARLEIAGAGLTSDSAGAGFELFDQVKLQSSDFSERVNYLRALQAELARTISSIPAVDAARVHINLPPKAVFLDQQSQPSASVMVKLRPGASLNQSQIRGIVHLVASGVENLAPERVSIVDASGGLITTGADSGFGAEQTGEEEAQSRRLQQMAQQVVDSILGPDRSRVSVRVELVRDRKTVQREVFEPGAGGKGVEKSVRQSQESYAGSVPGWVEQARAGASPSPAAPGAGASPAGGERPGYAQARTEIDYEISHRSESFEQSPGKIRRLTAAVLVDRAAKLDPASLQALAQGVKMTLGYDPERGDVFDIQVLPFDNYTAWKQENEEKMAQEVLRRTSEERLQGYLTGGGVAGGLLLTGLVGWLMSSRRRGQVLTEPLPLPEGPAPVVGAETAEVGELSIRLPRVEPELAPLNLEEALLRARETVRTQPQAMARMIETWILEDRAKGE